MEKYRNLADSVVRIMEEFAKLTSNTWDDNAALIARLLFQRYFGPTFASLAKSADSIATIPTEDAFLRACEKIVTDVDHKPGDTQCFDALLGNSCMP